ncbi:hypothetical protein FBU31_000362 [Coemansia sp. 'formosensis']|nr:hypothetical protein FBU31_000362 [Coemansia sp. 'formosensis']
MRVLSLIQLLPAPIIELIVDYVADHRPNASSRIPAHPRTHLATRCAQSEEHLARQVPLLWVCSNFRAVVLANFCKKCTIRFIGSHPNKHAVTRNTWPGRFKNLNLPVHFLAKELTMEVSLRDIYFGHALGMLVLCYNAGRVFPKVRSLDFQFTLIYSDFDIAAHSWRILKNIASFARYIGQIVPAIRKVSVSLAYSSDGVPRTPVPFFGDLVSQLYRLAIEVEYCRDCMSMPIELHPELVHNLTSMDCHSDTNIEPFLALARLNAPTIHSLAIMTRSVDGISGLVRHPNGGGYVQYACLCRLRLVLRIHVAVSRRSVFADALPFPVLRRLEILCNYPFGDDTLFRGNGRTLEYLHIYLDDLMVSVLNRHRVFTPVSHHKLRRIKVHHGNDTKPSALTTTSDYLRFVLNIAGNASICSFYSIAGSLGQDADTFKFDAYQHIRVLDMPKVRMTLLYTLDLVKSLPVLLVLYTLSPTLGQMPPGITQDKLPKYVAEKYRSIGKEFRCWGFTNALGSDVRRIAMCVLLSGIACPNLRYVAMLQASRSPFRSEICSLLRRKAFKNHVTRWEHMLKDNYQERRATCKYLFF